MNKFISMLAIAFCCIVLTSCGSEGTGGNTSNTSETSSDADTTATDDSTSDTSDTSDDSGQDSQPSDSVNTDTGTNTTVETGGETGPLVQLPGPATELAKDHIPDIPFPAPDENDYLMTETMAISFREILLSFKDTTTVEEANALLDGINATVMGSLSSAELLLIKVPLNNFDEMSELLKTLNADPRVEDALMETGDTPDNLPVHNVTPNLWNWQVPGLSLNPSPPPTDGNWGLELIRAPQMWNLDTYVQRKQSTNAVSAGVIDAGFTNSLNAPGPSTHPDFIRKDGTVILQIAPNSGGGTTRIDDHGTHIAGIIGAVGNNGAGAEGVNPWLKGIKARPVSFSSSNHNTWGRQLLEIFSLLSSDATVKAVNNSYSLSGTYAWIDQHDNNPADGSFDPLTISFGFYHYDVNLDTNIDPGEERSVWNNFQKIDLNHDGNPDAWSDVVARYGRFYNRAVTNFIRHKRGDFSLVSTAGNAGPYYTAEDVSPLANASVNFGVTTTPNFISVESIDWNNNASDFSMINGTLSAPGSCIRSTEAPDAENFDDTALPCPWIDRAADPLYGLYGTQSGTSMAAPHVTGLITALWKLDPSLNASDIRTLLTAPAYTQPTKGGTQRRIDAFAAAMGIDVIHNNTVLQEALVNVDDGTLDGNQRTVRDSVGNILGDFFTNNLGDGRRGDEEISMRDFRAFRDAVTQALLEEGALSASDVSLDGATTHFKKDLNFDGCIDNQLVNPPHPADTVPVPPSGCSNTPKENVFPRYDFNGDGRVNTLAVTEFKGTSRTDVQVLEDLWPVDISLNEGWNKSDLLSLLPEFSGSGDIEFRTSLLDNINTYDEIQISIEGLPKIPYRILTHTNPRLVWTVPRALGAITAKAAGYKDGNKVADLCFNHNMPLPQLKNSEDRVITITGCSGGPEFSGSLGLEGASSVWMAFPFPDNAFIPPSGMPFVSAGAPINEPYNFIPNNSQCPSLSPGDSCAYDHSFANKYALGELHGEISRETTSDGKDHWRLILKILGASINPGLPSPQFPLACGEVKDYTSIDSSAGTGHFHWGMMCASNSSGGGGLTLSPIAINSSVHGDISCSWLGTGLGSFGLQVAPGIWTGNYIDIGRCGGSTSSTEVSFSDSASFNSPSGIRVDTSIGGTAKAGQQAFFDYTPEQSYWLWGQYPPPDPFNRGTYSEDSAVSGEVTIDIYLTPL